MRLKEVDISQDLSNKKLSPLGAEMLAGITKFAEGLKVNGNPCAHCRGCVPQPHEHQWVENKHHPMGKDIRVFAAEVRCLQCGRPQTYLKIYKGD